MSDTPPAARHEWLDELDEPWGALWPMQRTSAVLCWQDSVLQ